MSRERKTQVTVISSRKLNDCLVEESILQIYKSQVVIMQN
jgi:hypothetical protein